MRPSKRRTRRRTQTRRGLALLVAGATSVGGCMRAATHIVTPTPSNGDGSVANDPLVLGTQTSPMSVEAADFARDGDDDIFVAHASGTVGVLVSNGDGSFAPQQVLDCDSNLRGVELGDLDGDCTLDVVSVSSSSQVVWLSQ